MIEMAAGNLWARNVSYTVAAADAERLEMVMLNSHAERCDVGEPREPRKSMRWTTYAVAIFLVAAAAGATLVSRHAPGGAAAREAYSRPAEIPHPDDNPYSAGKAALGRMLFFDPLLSGSQVRSCGTCHQPHLSWGDGRPRAIGEGEKPLALRSPTLLMVAWTPRLGWGRQIPRSGIGRLRADHVADQHEPDGSCAHGTAERDSGLCRGFCRRVRAGQHQSAQH